MKILLVEDNKTGMEAVQRLLEKANYEVITANGFEDGLEIALEEKPEVVISDYDMPDGNGLDLFKKLYQTDQLPYTRYILMSGRISRDLENLLAKNKPLYLEGFLRKPFTFAELDRLILCMPPLEIYNHYLTARVAS